MAPRHARLVALNLCIYVSRRPRCPYLPGRIPAFDGQPAPLHLHQRSGSDCSALQLPLCQLRLAALPCRTATRRHREVCPKLALSGQRSARGRYQRPHDRTRVACVHDRCVAKRPAPLVPGFPGRRCLRQRTCVAACPRRPPAARCTRALVASGRAAARCCAGTLPSSPAQ